MGETEKKNQTIVGPAVECSYLTRNIICIPMTPVEGARATCANVSGRMAGGTYANIVGHLTKCYFSASTAVK